MYETTGVLRPVVERHLAGEVLNPEQLAIMRAYLRQWVTLPFRGDDIDELRRSVDHIQSNADLRVWLGLADEAGVDPL